MQLLSIQSLLVLGVLALPALSASLPSMEASSAVSPGHSLHRRGNDQLFNDSVEAFTDVNDQGASLATMEALRLAAYNFDDETQREILAGVLRNEKEAEFFKALNAAIDQLIKKNSGNERLKNFKTICETALKQVEENPTGMLKYNRVYAQALYEILREYIHHTTLPDVLKPIKDTFSKLLNSVPLSKNVAEAITEKVLGNSDKVERQDALFIFLRDYVFGQELDAEMYKKVYGMKDATEFINEDYFVQAVILDVGSYLYQKEINDALEKVGNAPSANN
ncbi:hypothetical protein H4R35_006495 [Dimargaris xerosporica]|nr:hypothetical protein H4R35_006495 [Dimargaris xerosporica]